MICWKPKNGSYCVNVCTCTLNLHVTLPKAMLLYICVFFISVSYIIVFLRPQGYKSLGKKSLGKKSLKKGFFFISIDFKNSPRSSSPTSFERMDLKLINIIQDFLSWARQQNIPLLRQVWNLRKIQQNQWRF